jgi:hypothetical protein
MNREQLRQTILDGDRRLINSAAWRFLSTTEKALLRAGMEFWQRDVPVTNAALDDMIEIFNKNRTEGDEP